LLEMSGYPTNQELCARQINSTFAIALICGDQD
jgi:hypothetical protein